MAIGPPPGGPAWPAAQAATTSSRSGALTPVVIALVGLLIAVGAVAVTYFGGDSGGGTTAGGEVFLEAAASPGTSPFTEPLDPTPATTVLGAAGGRVGNVGPGSSATTSGPTSTPPTVTPVREPTSGVQPPPGSPPYGGTGDNSVCDREKLVAFLTSHPPQAAAWAGVLGVAVADIPTYVRGLTPTVLLYDTRVTNHGFVDGRATPIQSVLQAGTAVLVDSKGNPVVRCRCGNPLRPPAPVRRPTVQGTPWPGYVPTALVAVNNGATVNVTVIVTTPTNPTPTASTSASTAPTTTAPPVSTVPPGSSAPSITAGGTTTLPPGSPADVAGLQAILAECAPQQVTILDVRIEPDLPHTFSVRARVKEVEMLFTYDNETGRVTEGDRASAELLDSCGVQR